VVPDAVVKKQVLAAAVNGTPVKSIDQGLGNCGTRTTNGTPPIFHLCLASLKSRNTQRDTYSKK
jgi:hypothetical protein